MARTNEPVVISRATSRFQRVSARKARLVADLIRGESVRDATRILETTHRPSAVPIIHNLLKSAAANVDRSAHGDSEDLIVGEIQVDEGPIMYRLRHRARGRASRIRKRFCHISMKLTEE